MQCTHQKYSFPLLLYIPTTTYFSLFQSRGRVPFFIIIKLTQSEFINRCEEFCDFHSWNFVAFFFFFYWVKEFYQFYDVQECRAKVLMEINNWVENLDFGNCFTFTLQSQKLHLEFFSSHFTPNLNLNLQHQKNVIEVNITHHHKKEL